MISHLLRTLNILFAHKKGAINQLTKIIIAMIFLGIIVFVILNWQSDLNQVSNLENHFGGGK